MYVKSSNIGECHYRHDQEFKISFENDPNREYYQTKYEETLISFLESITSEVDLKMKRCLERIEAPVPEQVINKDVQEEIEQLDQQISEKLKQAEHLGEIGMIDESEKLTKEIEQIKVQRSVLTNTKEYPAIYKDRQMKVCEICGALQSAQDNEKRIQTHKEGKIHSAYLKIRQYLDLLRKKRIERRIKEAELKEKDKLIKELKEKEKEKYIDKDYKRKYSNDKEKYSKRYDEDEDYDIRKRNSRSRYSRNRSRNKSYSRDKKKYEDRYYHEDKYRYKDKEIRRDMYDRDNRDYRDMAEGRYIRDRDRDREERSRRDKRDYERDIREIRNKRDDRDKSPSYRYENKKRI
jgi:hypothetical protein